MAVPKLNYYKKALDSAAEGFVGPQLPAGAKTAPRTPQGSFTQRGDGSFAGSDFLKTVGDFGLTRENFSDYDWDAATADPEWGVSLATIKRDYGRASTDQQRALLNEQANQLRRLKGYSADESGLGYYLVQDQREGEPFRYANENMYQKALNEVVNPAPFQWDLETDPVWPSYKKQYLREGQRATANALGQASAATGGRPSSYAMTAASQAGDYYAAKLTDMIPTIYQDAYNRYLQEFQQKLQGVGALENDRAQQYRAWLGDVERAREDEATAYQRQIQEAETARRDEETAYQRELQAQEQARKDAALARELSDRAAGYGDYTGLQREGINTEYIQALQAAQLAQQQAQTQAAQLKAAGVGTGSGTRVSSGSGSSGGSGTRGTAEPDYEGLFRAASQAQSPTNYISSNYKKFGFTHSSGLPAAYKEWAKAGDQYRQLEKDLTELQAGGATLQQINNVLVNAANNGIITREQRDALRKTYVGHGR